jgi:thiol-disulfide isomerase/thioredoxin
MKRVLVFNLIVLTISLGIFAQSGKVKENPPAVVAGEELTAEKMYSEANDFAKLKFDEFNEKKIRFSEALRQKTLREQKQLAAKYAAILAKNTNLKADDVYFWGMLHWLAENADGANEALQTFLATENPNVEKSQMARGIVVITSARKKNFEDAEKYLLQYLNNNPVKVRERSEMENELATAYFSVKNYPQAAAHAEESYRLVKSFFSEQSSRARGLAEILDRGTTLFQIYKDSENTAKADLTLEDLRKSAVVTQSNGIYFYAVDAFIKFMIATNRKPLALKIADQIKSNIEKDFIEKSTQTELIARFKKRDKHYKLLGDTAPDLIEINTFLPIENKNLSSLRGKVIVLDFWATWCGPCYETFPVLTELYQNYKKDGLEADEKTEIKFLEEFKAREHLPYSFVVSQNNTNQIIYGAGGLPTAIIIDRQGIVRYIETGTTPTRNDEIQAVVEKLLNEK